jgi:hypothetical protein
MTVPNLTVDELAEFLFKFMDVGDPTKLSPTFADELKHTRKQAKVLASKMLAAEPLYEVVMDVYRDPTNKHNAGARKALRQANKRREER